MAVYIIAAELGSVIEISDASDEDAPLVAECVDLLARSGMPLNVTLSPLQAVSINFSRLAVLEFTVENSGRPSRFKLPLNTLAVAAQTLPKPR